MVMGIPKEGLLDQREIEFDSREYEQQLRGRESRKMQSDLSNDFEPFDSFDDCDGGIYETICSTATTMDDDELDLLCDLFDRLINSTSTKTENGIQVLLHDSESKMFFAPNNEAIMNLPLEIESDIMNSDIALLNVLMTHVAMINNQENTPGTNGTNNFLESEGILLHLVGELECDEELVMINNETTKTICIKNADGMDDKIQLGNGNMYARSLPKLISINDEIVTCDQKSVIHVVDQVILPSLPLISTSGRIEDDKISSESSASQTVVPSTSLDFVGSSNNSIAVDNSCPLLPPDIANTGSAKCNFDETCEYGHQYTGCTWTELRCISTTNCICNNEGSWECSAVSIVACVEEDQISSTLPIFESCNPDDELLGATEGTSLNQNNVHEEEQQDDSLLCPIEAPESFVTPCRNNIDTKCDYQFVFTGCSWEDLACTATISCECFDGIGAWGCDVFTLAPCRDDTPDGLPFGEVCNPTESLILRQVDEEDISVALIEERIPNQ